MWPGGAQTTGSNNETKQLLDMKSNGIWRAFQNLFFNQERYDLSEVGRMKFNRRLKIDESNDDEKDLGNENKAKQIQRQGRE